MLPPTQHQSGGRQCRVLPSNRGCPAGCPNCLLSSCELHAGLLALGWASGQLSSASLSPGIPHWEAANAAASGTAAAPALETSNANPNVEMHK